jgi:hypothetical protein
MPLPVPLRPASMSGGRCEGPAAPIRQVEPSGIRQQIPPYPA